MQVWLVLMKDFRVVFFPISKALKIHNLSLSAREDQLVTQELKESERCDF